MPSVGSFADCRLGKIFSGQGTFGGVTQFFGARRNVATHLHISKRHWGHRAQGESGSTCLGLRVKTILIAASPAAAETITEALGGIGHTKTAQTVDEAAATIARGVDLIVAGTYFDGGRMFDLLRLVKECEEWRDIPFLCVRGAGAPDADDDGPSKPLLANLDIVDSASRALGAVGFVDLCDRSGPMRAQTALTQLALACLN